MSNFIPWAALAGVLVVSIIQTTGKNTPPVQEEWTIKRELYDTGGITCVERTTSIVRDGTLVREVFDGMDCLWLPAELEGGYQDD